MARHTNKTNREIIKGGLLYVEEAQEIFEKLNEMKGKELEKKRTVKIESC